MKDACFFATKINLSLLASVLVSGAVILRIFSNPVGNVFQKQLTTKSNHPLIVNFFTYFPLPLICIAFAINIPVHKLTSEFWLYSILGGIVGSVGNGFLIKSLEKGELSGII